MYNNLVPPNTFIADYMHYLSPLESPLSYDFWSGVWLMSLALGRHVVVPRPRTPVYMNWYTMLVAESGVTRKSTVVRIATEVAREFIKLDGDPIEFIETKISPERFENCLHLSSIEHGYAHAAISISELVNFLGREKYVRAMPGLLTDLYDSPSIRSGGGTLHRGSTLLRNVYVSFISASTPSWLVRAINPDVIEGGYTSRNIFVVDEHPKQRVAWPSDEAKEDARERLGVQLQTIRQHAKQVGKIDVTPQALKRFTEWYETRPLSLDPFNASFEAREDAHILRLAGTLSANDDRWQINASDIRKSTEVIRRVKEDGAAIFAGTGFSSRYVLGVDKTREILLAGGIDGVKQAALTIGCKSYFKAEELRTLLEIMHELEMVQRFDDVTTGGGRRATIWRATRKLSVVGSMEAIVAMREPAKS